MLMQGQTGAHGHARGTAGSVLRSSQCIDVADSLTLLIVDHCYVAVSGGAPRRSLEADALRCRGVDQHQKSFLPGYQRW